MKCWLVCSQCGHAIEVMENEVYGYGDCAICGGTMILDMNKGKVIEEAVGDNFPHLPQEREMLDSISSIGQNATWKMIEAISDIKLRLRYRELFFKCGGIMPESEE